MHCICVVEGLSLLRPGSVRPVQHAIIFRNTYCVGAFTVHTVQCVYPFASVVRITNINFEITIYKACFLLGGLPVGTSHNASWGHFAFF